MDNLLIVNLVVLWTLVLINLLVTLAIVRRINTESNNSQEELELLKKGEVAPEFTAKTLQGDIVTLRNYIGRSVAFLFMTPTCSMCRDTLYTYQTKYSKAKQKGVELVLVSGVDESATRTFVDEYNITSLPVLVDPEPSLVHPFGENSFFKDYNVSSVPSYCLINSKGEIQSSGHPSLDGGKWDKLVVA